MSNIVHIPLFKKIIKWIARIWSLLVAAVILIMAFTPDPNIVNPVPFEDYLLLSFYGISGIALLAAWRWEIVSGITAIAALFCQAIAYRIINGEWFLTLVAFPGLLFIIPAILYIIAGYSCRGRRTP